MIHFCTLFDSNYSARGLAMYESLVRNCLSFHLFIFAFDDKLARALEKMALEYVTVVTLKEFEDEELLAVKPTRTPGEYYWTCSGSTILYCLQHFNIDSCTYLDADLYFFTDPSVLIDEMGDDDVMITEHRYTPVYDQSKTSGKYCVQFMTFKNNPNGLKILKWWRNACLDWCYGRYEDGKFGDQKYLDDWTTRFSGVHELQHLGGGVAPWNMQQYEFKRKGKDLVGVELATNKEFPLVFFHFHNLQCYKKGMLREFLIVDPFYVLNTSVRKYIYCTYLPELRHCYHKMKKANKDINGIPIKPMPKSLYANWYIICKRVIRTSLSLEKYYSHWIEY